MTDIEMTAARADELAPEGGTRKPNSIELEEELLSELRPGEVMGNVTLRTKLATKGWDEGQYWTVRNRLIEAGKLTTGRGRGGSVRRVTVEADKEPETIPASPGNATIVTAVNPYPTERDLYPPMSKVILNDWAKDNRLDDLFVEITAHQGAKPTGGKWTRPDITVASYKTYPYVPGKHFDIITFEIKPCDGLDVTIIYEALGHRRAATRAYALAHVPDDKRQDFDPLIEEISQEAKRFGIGFIVAADPTNYDTWEELVEADRKEPDPERLNEFLASQVSQSLREQLNKWYR